MISTILSYLAVAVVSAIIGIFIYRNNTDLIGSKADAVDKVWDRLRLSVRIEALEEKIDELLNK